MKNLEKTLLACLLLMLMACSGSEYDDSSLWTQVKSNTSRIEALESQISSLNSDLTSIKTIVSALENGITISKVVDIDGGYTIVFSDGTSITINDGKDGTSAPTVGVALYGGVYYWTITVDGETSWLLDNSGNRLRVNGTDGTDGKNGTDGTDGVTPLIRVSSTGYWEVSYDNGKTYTSVLDANGNKVQAVTESGSGTTSYFNSVTYTETEVTFVLTSGASFVVPIEQEFDINFSSYEAVLSDTETTLEFDVEGYDSNTFVECCAHGNIKANVKYNRGSQFGHIEVSVTGTIDSDTKLVVFLCNKVKMITKVITFTASQDTRIDDVIPPVIQDSIGEYMPIYRGTNPPNIEGCYVMDEPEVVHCQDWQDGGFADGLTGFNDIYMRFSNYNSSDKTLDYEKIEGSNTAEGKGSFISGSGNYFTVYFDTEGISNGISTKTALVISGEKTSTGIRNLRYAFVMVEKGSDPKNTLMAEGVYRIFKDSDELASKTTWPGASSAKTRGFDVLKSIWSSNK